MHEWAGRPRRLGTRRRGRCRVKYRDRGAARIAGCSRDGVLKFGIDIVKVRKALLRGRRVDATRFIVIERRHQAWDAASCDRGDESRTAVIAAGESGLRWLGRSGRKICIATYGCDICAASIAPPAGYTGPPGCRCVWWSMSKPRCLPETWQPALLETEAVLAFEHPDKIRCYHSDDPFRPA
ncbi:hypothetical protein PHSY_001991 [Pseudozyma hubeiensis SY62]|uniref:Uncharacterized protein n=1 Tax=Pseudozyma hubeiensis (strain SY62) TaxID=1305764 RepID=R9P8L9_PSEHS|nr:hypothetical protein PHSY_001991 [Pseudozyma hubeiensis SY62]GAC94420.1 hypothetical protein PHSY_001991 [Pseudozyma hubeiensis SY62]